MDQFDSISDNLAAAFHASEVGILFIDCDFNVRPISFPASDLFEVGPAREPWPLKEIIKHIDYASLAEDLRKVWENND